MATSRTVPCQHCGAPTSPSETGAPPYCSLPCYDAHHIRCEVCGGAMFKPRRPGRPATACSPACTRDRAIAQTYGLPPERYHAMRVAADYACQACGEPEGDRALAVDHDHRCCPSGTSCGMCVRGLLCHRCNVAAGYLRDSADAAEGLARYLRVTMAPVSVILGP